VGQYKHPRWGGWNFISHIKIKRFHGSHWESLVILMVKKMRWISLWQNGSEKHGGRYQSWAFRKKEKVRESGGMDRIQTVCPG